MTKRQKSAIWQVYRDVTASLPEQTDPKVASASRRFIKAFHSDLAKAEKGLISASSLADHGKNPPVSKRK